MKAIALALLVLAGCSSSGGKTTECDDQRPCASNRVCVQGGACASGCGADGGCPEGMSCTATGPFCPENGSCPAIAVLVCLGADGGT